MSRRLLFMLLLLLIVPSAGAQLFSCSASAPTVNFGNYTGALVTPGATPLSVTCPLLVAYTVSLNAGTGAGATTTTRKMTGPGSSTLNYQLFQNSSRTTNWGNTVGTDTVAGTGSLSAQTLNIYPQLSAGQNNAPGTYTDTITVSVQTIFGTNTATFTVTATIVANCLLSASPLNMGTYSGALLNATSLLTVTCTNTTVFNIGLNAGTSTGATVTTRKMTGPGSATLNYNLFRNSALTQNWGMTVGTDTFSSTGNGLAQNFTVYGQVPAGQFVAPGTYNDTIIATITY
jgi:spore coat protein U-like protein